MALILQSHAAGPPYWIQQCTASVRDWAARQGHEYRCIDDGLFDFLPADVRARTRLQPVIASDLARLLWLRQELARGAQCVVWLDADSLLFAPQDFELRESSYALGREVWIQAQGRRWRCYRKVHNAFLMFRPGNPLLAFYIHSAERILREYGAGPMAPQLIGPKLLSALHSLGGGPVQESAVVLSPPVIQDLLNGGGPALDLYKAKSTGAAACANLCASSLQRGELGEVQMLALINALQAQPQALA